MVNNLTINFIFAFIINFFKLNNRDIVSIIEFQPDKEICLRIEIIEVYFFHDLLALFRPYHELLHFILGCNLFFLEYLSTVISHALLVSLERLYL